MGVSESTWHRWLSQHVGSAASDAKRLKELEGENARLKLLVAESELDKAMLSELSEGDFDPGRKQRRQDAARTLRSFRARA